MKYNFYIALLILINVNVWAAGEMPEEEHRLKALRQEYIDAYYETVMTSADTREVDVITKNLDPKAFPILPTSHRFEREGEGAHGIWSITRHRSMPDAALEIYAFGRDAPNAVNYIVKSSGRTTYSYMHTRRPDDLFKGERNRYVFKVKGKVGAEGDAPAAGAGAAAPREISYLDGHCGDQADTAKEELRFYKVGSDCHAANRIPEPKNREGTYSHWGQNWRRYIVDDFRRENKSYGQWVFYNSDPLIATGGVPVPLGIAFMGHHMDGRLINGWAIPWNDPIHLDAPILRGSRAYLHILRSYDFEPVGSTDRFFGSARSPHSFTYIKDGLDPYFAHLLSVPETVTSPKDHLSLYRLETLGDSEILPYYSGCTLDFFLDQLDNGPNAYYAAKASYWANRFKDHVLMLQNNDEPISMSPDIEIETLIEKVAALPHFDMDHTLEDELAHIRRNLSRGADPEDFGGVMRKLFQDFDEKLQIASPYKPPKMTSIPYKLPTGDGSKARISSPLPLSTFKAGRTFIIDARAVASSWKKSMINAFLEANAKGLAISGYEILI